MDDRLCKSAHVNTTTVVPDHSKIQKSLSVDEVSDFSHSDDDDDSYTTYYDDYYTDDECDETTSAGGGGGGTVDELLNSVDIEWITTAITRILSDDENDDDGDDADDERSPSSKQGINIEWNRLGLLSEAISQFIEEEDDVDECLCVERVEMIESGLPLLIDSSSSSEVSVSR
jgi:hypothetical protein